MANHLTTTDPMINALLDVMLTGDDRRILMCGSFSISHNEESLAFDQERMRCLEVDIANARKAIILTQLVIERKAKVIETKSGE